MFEKDYKNQMDKIKPDGFIRYKVGQRLLQSDKVSEKKQHRFYFVKAVATALCIALVFTLGAVIGRHTAPVTPMLQSGNALQAANNYDNIYSTLEVFKQSLWDKAVGYFTNGGYYKYTDDMAVVEETATDINATIAKPNASDGAADDSSHSQTTTQVDGVDEADVVKTDGKYIYILNSDSKNPQIKIVKIDSTPKQLSSIAIDEGKYVYVSDMYLNGDRLVALCTDNQNITVKALIYDISNPAKPKKLPTCTQSGNLNTSRLIGNKLYVISEYYVDVNDMVKSDTESYIPYIECNKYEGAVKPDTVHFYSQCKYPQYTVISAFNIKDSKLISTQSVLGGTETVYSSTDNIIVAGMSDGEKTQIARFRIQDGVIELKASAELSGRLLNQFSIDEYKDHFRFVLTERVVLEEGSVTKNDDSVSKTIDKSITVNSLVILDSDLKKTGEITDIAPDERVYSVRFMGDTAYFVTFRQVDPLFSVDVSNPESPKIIGALKIPGFSNYLFPYGKGKLLGIGQNADENTGRTGSMKLSMFDISDPANVTESDKTDIAADYSAALYNHKAVLVDYNKNIIAFAASDSYNKCRFYVYCYQDGEFVKRLESEMDQNTGLARGIYIGKTFYIVTDSSLEYYNIASFEKTGELKLS